MEIPDNVLDPKLYKQAQKKANETYKRHSAYKSMFLVKPYKDLGGKYSTEKKMGKLERWRKEKWVSVKDYLDGKIIECGSSKINNNACRPTKKLDKNTPITIQELIKKHGKTKLKNLVNKKLKNMDKYINWEEALIK